MYERVGVRAAVGPRSRFLLGGQTMMRLIGLLLSLAVCLAGCSQKQADQEEKVVNAILELRGTVERDEKLPGRPVVEVHLEGPKVTDSDLKNLKELKGLQTLDLGSTKITDAGLKDLKELKGLQTLRLTKTRITDAGLKDLKELKGLQELWLVGTKITDAGLKDLKELKGLQRLDLGYTKITDAGLKELALALPKTEIWGP
jgi:internalin A